MYTIRLPFFLRIPVNNLIWRKPKSPPVVYLTFDDGPIPEVSPHVLEILKQEQVKATFFCVGENVKKHPEVYQQILEQGHRVGQHTYNHLPAFKHSKLNYANNVAIAQGYIESDLFRPPHGQIRWSQILKMRHKFRIVLWDVLSGDFDQNITPNKCLSNVIKYTRNGSVIVFHDSIKAQENLLYALPRAIKYLKKKGYSFELL